MRYSKQRLENLTYYAEDLISRLVQPEDYFHNTLVLKAM